MPSDTEIKSKVIALLSEYLGDIETERFIPLIQREPLWQQGLNENFSIEEISRKAMLLRKQKETNLIT